MCMGKPYRFARMLQVTQKIHKRKSQGLDTAKAWDPHTPPPHPELLLRNPLCHQTGRTEKGCEAGTAPV